MHTDSITGVAKATNNWWFAHNLLGLWLTPVGLATAYFLIPKVIGRPVHSYHLSLLGSGHSLCFTTGPERTI